MDHTNNKRVAKNAIALTLRMVLVTIVGLFTSRIVLQVLGVTDYGIYGVIGGVVGMASFLNTSMAGATSRFITFELGRGNDEKLKSIFSSALIIHIILALIVTVLAETVGLWFVNNKMNFPADSMFAVNVLYQFTILSMFVNFTQVPYSAAIIAHEKMNIYAYFEIINVVLKLVIVYLLLVVTSNRLILYAGLTLAVSVISAFIYRLYGIRHFKETHFLWRLKKSIVREMLSFSGFDLYGHMCVVAKNQGQPIILNLFYGVVANAASSIALTITGAVNGLTMSILQAFRPQIIKQYSVGRIDLTATLSRRAVQFTLMAYVAIAVPVIIETPLLLKLWLGQIPLYAVIFIRLIIISSLLNIVVNVSNACIHATGNIKNISFISGSCYLLSPIASYILMRFGSPAFTVYLVDIAMYFAVISLGMYFIKIQIPGFAVRRYALVVVKSLIVFVLSLLIVSNAVFLINKCAMLNSCQNEYILILSELVICVVLNLVISGALFCFMVFNKTERNVIVSKLFNRKNGQNIIA